MIDRYPLNALHSSTAPFKGPNGAVNYSPRIFFLLFAIKWQSLELALMVGLIATYTGCSEKPTDPSRAIVSGIVTFSGQPLKGGSITFQSVDKPTGTRISIDSDGRYTTDRAPLGKNLVTIETESLQYGNAAAYVKIPAKYNDVTNSGLTADVKPGENEINFTLEK
jgi:hypothetical protein